MEERRLSIDEKIKILEWRIHNWQREELYHEAPEEMGVSESQVSAFDNDMFFRWMTAGASSGSYLNMFTSELSRLNKERAKAGPVASAAQAPTIGPLFYITDFTKDVISRDKSLTMDKVTDMVKEFEEIKTEIAGGKWKADRLKSRLAHINSNVKGHEPTLLTLADWLSRNEPGAAIKSGN